MTPELIELEVLRWAHGGDGVGFPAEGPLRGAVVFVPRTVPGDRVRCRVVRRKRRWARTELISVERPSPLRVEPECPHQRSCGGCPWMIGARQAQATSRLAILRGEARKRLGWSEAEAAHRVRLAEARGADLGYRTRVRVAWSVDAATGEVRVGYRRARSRGLVDVARCPVAVPAIERALVELRTELARRGRGEGEASLLAGEEGVAVEVRPAGREPWRLGPDEVTVHHGDVPIVARAGAFVQANPVVAAQIAAHVQRVADVASGARDAVELFCGVGTLTVPLLRAGWRVSGAYEVDGSARPLFERNVQPWLRGAGATDARFVVADLLTAGSVEPPPPARPALVLLDPPRTGATRARGGPYRVRAITGYDMFPHTGHQEVVCELERGSEGADQSEQL